MFPALPLCRLIPLLAVVVLSAWGADIPPTVAAAMTWCRDDAAAATAAGQDGIAAADAADALTLGASTITVPAAIHEDLLPAIPGPIAGNPIAVEALRRVEQLVQEHATFAKGAQGIAVSFDGGWVVPRRADQLLLLTQAFCHPHSPLANDPRLVVPILRRVAAISEYLVPGSKLLGNFGFADTVAEAWLILRTTHPEILPPGLATRTEQGLRLSAAAILASSGASYRDPSVHYGVMNCDVRLILALALTDRLFPDMDLGETIAGGVRFLGHSILADGATHYAERQNECFSYHGIAVRSLLRLSQISRLPRTNAEALELVRRMRWYVPLSVEPSGVAEWSTACSWHHYWNTSTGSEAALIIAAVTGCPHNQRIAQAWQPTGDLWLASLRRTDIAPAPTPDNYVLYDRNVEGPRGRFGHWSFVATGRNFGYGADDRARGKSSYVGAMVSGGSGAWPLSAAVQDVGSAVKVSAKALDTAEITWMQQAVCLSTVESTTTAVAQRCAALGANSRLGAYAQKTTTPWRQRQAWVFTPERMVGVVTLSADQDTTAQGMMGTIMLVSGRNSWGQRKDLVEVAPGAYTYGDLALTIHAHDYADIIAQETDVMTGFAVAMVKPQGKALRLVLRDGPAVADARTVYAKGSTHRYVVEIRPRGTAAAALVEQVDQGTLLTATIRDGSGTYHLAYNPEGEPASWTPPAAVGAVLHRSGETYRPGWLGAQGTPEATGAATPLPGGRIDLPAGQLALIESSRGR